MSIISADPSGDNLDRRDFESSVEVATLSQLMKMRISSVSCGTLALQMEIPVSFTFRGLLIFFQHKHSWTEISKKKKKKKA